jgi:hypothetical protein
LPRHLSWRGLSLLLLGLLTLLLGLLPLLLLPRLERPHPRVETESEDANQAPGDE